MRIGLRVILVIILLFAAAARFYALGRASYWFDEFWSLEESTGRGLAHLSLPANQLIFHPPDLTTLDGAPPAWRIWTSLRRDSQPPLYFLLLRFWREGVGDSEAMVRLLSALLSIIALVFFFLIVRMQVNLPAALWATALMTAAGSQIHMAQDARSYTLWLALAMFAGWVILRIEKFGITIARVLVTAAAALAMVLTHYFAVLTCLSLLIYALLRLRGRQRIWTILSFIVAGIIFIIIWGPFLLQQRRSLWVNNNWQYNPDKHYLLDILWHLVQLPMRWLSEPALIAWPAVVLLAAAVGWALWRWRRSPGVMFWFIWAAPLILAVVLIDAINHTRCLMFMRYTFVAGPAIFFLAAIPVFMIRSKWIHAIPAVLLALCLGTILGSYSQVRDWRNVAAMLRQNVGSQDTIIYAAGGYPSIWPTTTFLGISHYAPNLPAPIVILTDPHSPVVQRAINRGHSMWVLCNNQSLPANALDPAAAIARTGIAPSIGRVSQLKIADDRR